MAASPIAFIINHGSFNPVHRHHVEMMVQAKQRLEAAGFQVLKGFLAITSSKRLAKKGAEAVADKHRLAALQLACDCASGPPGWLVPEPRGVKFGSGSQCVRGLLPELLAEAPNAIVFKVVGADTAVRYAREMEGPTVVICRAGSTELLQQAVRFRTDLFIVDELRGEECSSTKLRKALHANDLGTIRSMCPEPVAEYLLKHQASLYSEANSQPVQHGYGSRAASNATAGGDPMVENRFQLVIGVTGATRSGKTTLSKNLANAFGPIACVIVGQDDFRLKGKRVAADSWVEKGGTWLRDWETPNQTDWPALEEAIRLAMSRFSIVIVEGYCLLHSEVVCQLLHSLVWVETDEGTCRHRRTSYPKGWDQRAYFDECVWPAHSRYRAAVFGASGAFGQSGKSSSFAGRTLLLSGGSEAAELGAEAQRAVELWRASSLEPSDTGGPFNDRVAGPRVSRWNRSR